MSWLTVFQARQLIGPGSTELGQAWHLISPDSMKLTQCVGRPGYLGKLSKHGRQKRPKPVPL
jgi:hypothetical protein